jgi:hypothetical protein
VERAVYLAVLERLLKSESDRAGERWWRGIRVGGSEGLKLYRQYRAMGWLGNNLAEVEEALFQRRRDSFTECPLPFLHYKLLF